MRRFDEPIQVQVGQAGQESRPVGPGYLLGVRTEREEETLMAPGNGIPVDRTVLILIDRAHEALLAGYAAESATARHRAAHLAALRAAAAVVAARDPRRRQDRLGPVSLWDLLVRLTPELSEWSRHFALVTRRRGLVESGRVRVSVREADDLIRDAETFLSRTESAIGLPVRIDLTPGLAPVRSA